MVLIEILALASIPFFVTLALTDITFVSNYAMISFWAECLVKYYICYFASAYIPLPGGTGLMEIAFIFLFGVTVSENIVWALLAWRFLSYYLIILHGFIHELRHIIVNLIKNRKKRKV